MKNKYVMISGFAFSEESDMEKLKNYAKEGWILEDIVGGFFYKLKKDLNQEIVYSLDYQSEPSEEYFTLFKEAGWTPVVSVGNEMHIFSGPTGIKPIYSDKESEIEKYTRMKIQTGRGALYSFITGIVLMIILFVSVITIRPIFLIVLGLFMINIIVFIFNFLPYLAYNHRIRQINKCYSKKGL
ncbi:DUF2812 domain-containing protein [Clostridium algidicarnis]|uniref:DUF2812 domain-containing protein n=1 Tax=Clostridium algidicarnis TaxID=37659 RepID=UPI001C0AEA84|nr:DUF2812 domain-containing protein [Clostridium algidicarnis]MBU3250622.1 DUF2812 domain-containing protein [Clostridium algidicarnis]